MLLIENLYVLNFNIWPFEQNSLTMEIWNALLWRYFTKEDYGYLFGQEEIIV